VILCALMAKAFDLEAIRHAVRSGRLRWRMHALERMPKRRLSTTHVKQVILNGEVIEEYPTSAPYPSGLLHAVVDGRPIHAVVAWNRRGQGTPYVITAYEPDESHFQPNLKTRKKASKRRSDDE
jgi:hypothetical protein